MMTQLIFLSLKFTSLLKGTSSLQKRFDIMILYNVILITSFKSNVRIEASEVARNTPMVLIVILSLLIKKYCRTYNELSQLEIW